MARTANVAVKSIRGKVAMKQLSGKRIMGKKSGIARKMISSKAPRSPRKKKASSGSAALKQIKTLQRSTSMMIPRAPFGRLVREIASKFGDFRFQWEALGCLQEATELYLSQLFEGEEA